MEKKKGDCLLLGTRALQLHRQLVTDNSSEFNDNSSDFTDNSFSFSFTDSSLPTTLQTSPTALHRQLFTDNSCIAEKKLEK